MTRPEKWSDLTYFILGMVIGALAAYGWLETFEPAHWIQTLTAFSVPLAVGFLAMPIREKLFWFWP